MICNGVVACGGIVDLWRGFMAWLYGVALWRALGLFIGIMVSTVTSAPCTSCPSQDIMY